MGFWLEFQALNCGLRSKDSESVIEGRGPWFRVQGPRFGVMGAGYHRVYGVWDLEVGEGLRRV
jgi:hypothetical protein